jgi:DNA-binding XRE family transcriptional regulator
MFTKQPSEGGIVLKIVTDTKALVVTRIRAGLSQNSLSKQAKVSKTLICQIEGGNRNPSAKTARKICDALGVEFEEIFFIESGR